MDVDKLIAQSSLSTFHCHSLRLLRYCTLFGKDGRRSWKDKIQWCSDSNCFKDLNQIDGQPVEFEWKIFPGLTSVGILDQMIGEFQCEPENFTGRIIFMSMFNDTEGDAKGNDELCVISSKTIKQYARRFPRGHWSFLGPTSEMKWYGTYDCKPDGSSNPTAEKMLLYFAGSGHPIFRGTSALERRIRKQSKLKEVNTLQQQHPKH